MTDRQEGRERGVDVQQKTASWDQTPAAAEDSGHGAHALPVEPLHSLSCLNSTCSSLNT